VQVNSNPVVALGNDSSICQGDMIVLDAGNAGSSFAWCSSETTQTISVGMPGSYCVNVMDANGCSASDTLNLTVNNLPSIATSGDSICAGSSGSVTVTGTASAYLWNPGSFSGAVVTDNPATTTTYTVTGTDNNGCSAIDSATIVVNMLPAIQTTGDTICLNSSATVSVTGDATTYLWQPGNIANDTLLDSPVANATYTVTATHANGCAVTDSAVVVVNALPAVTATSFGTHCLDDASFTLTGGSPAGGIYSGPGVSSGSLSPTTAGNGTHAITYSYTDANGCSATATASVIIDPCTGIISNSEATGVSVYPNPFHESATVVVSENTVLENATFTLYDITGKIVLEMKNVSSTTISINRNELENGVYFYTFINNGVIIGSGRIVVE
jgi:hypothetical protein